MEPGAQGVNVDRQYRRGHRYPRRASTYFYGCANSILASIPDSIGPAQVGSESGWRAVVVVAAVKRRPSRSRTMRSLVDRACLGIEVCDRVEGGCNSSAFLGEEVVGRAGVSLGRVSQGSGEVSRRWAGELGRPRARGGEGLTESRTSTWIPRPLRYFLNPGGGNKPVLPVPNSKMSASSG